MAQATSKGRKLRILVAKPGLDGHDRGAKVVARALAEAGYEVVYTGLHQTPEMIAATAVQEDVDAVGLSIMSGAHMTLCPAVIDLLKQQSVTDISVFGGGIIPDEDIPNRLRLLTSWIFKREGGKCLHLSESLLLRNPTQRIINIRRLIGEAKKLLGQNTRYSIGIQRQRVGGLSGKLNSLSPLSIVQRGYSITRKLPSLQILRDTADVKEGEKVEVKLYRGALICWVEKIEKP